MVKSLIFHANQYRRLLIQWGATLALIIGLTFYSLLTLEKSQHLPQNIKITLTIIISICISGIVYVTLLYGSSRIKNKPQFRLKNLMSAYLSILDNLEIGVIVLETNGNPIFINRFLISRLRYSRNELIEIGSDFTDRIIAPGSKAASLQYFNEAALSMWKGTQELMKIELISKENEHMWFEMSLMPFKSDEGIELCLINFNEITVEIQGEIKLAAAEAKHRKSETLLRDILKYVSAWIYVKDIKGNFLLASDSMIRYLGYDPVGMNDFQMVPFDTAALFTELDNKVVATKRHIEFEYDFPLGMANNDGSEPFRALCKRFPMVDASGEVYGIGVINIDITEQLRQREALKIARQQAEVASGLQEQFLSNMSHELRTPLNGILGMNQIMMETEMTGKQLELAVSIRTSAETMKSIVNSLLDLSKIKAGKMTFERVNFDLLELFTNLSYSFGQIAKNMVKVRLNIPPDLPRHIKGDPTRLCQILSNLIGNAVKFTRQGEIEIMVEIRPFDTGQVLVVSVKDSGIGISQERLNEIFEPFMQNDGTITRRFGGSGLGLTITKQLLELQGGSIDVDSAIGKGSVFTFTLPVEIGTDDGFGQDTPIVEMVPGSLTGKQFLSIEDQEVNQKIVVHLLTRAGGTVITANNGKEAIDIISSGIPLDLILLDLQMPEMDGFATTDIIRNELKLNVPIIAMTASAMQGEKERCLSKGINEYMSKPFDFDEFYRNVYRLILKHSPAVQENPPYSISRLQELGNHAFLREMMLVYLNTVPRLLLDMENALIEKRFVDAKKLAHSAMSPVGFFQADQLYEILHQIEINADTEGWEGICQILLENARKINSAIIAHMRNNLEDPINN